MPFPDAAHGRGQNAREFWPLWKFFRKFMWNVAEASVPASLQSIFLTGRVAKDLLSCDCPSQPPNSSRQMPNIEAMERLLEELSSGDDAAVERVFRRYEPYLRMVVRRALSKPLRAKFDSVDIV